ncbi:MAG TPA: EpsI family protein [Anaerolineales bacterium]
MIRTLSWARTAVVLALLLATFFVLQLRAGDENMPARLPLSAFPLEVAAWKGWELEIDQQTRTILGDGDFMLRNYGRSDAEPVVNLFIAYFPSQRTGSTIHSPQNCLPGAGWVPVESARVELANSAVINRMVISKGLDRQLVYYWYHGNGRVVASEYWAKFYLVADAIRWNRSDGALVRVLTPVLPDEKLETAEARVSEFALQIYPSLPAYVPD